MNYGHGYSRPRRSKYNNNKTIVDGIRFDSEAEANRWCELKLLQRAGKIAGLDRQVKYELIPEYREPDRIGPKGGRKKGKIISSKKVYIADFVYYDSSTGELVVEDVKGYRGGEAYKVFQLKKALMYDRYKILVKEV